jgi:hypothetical protein
VAPTPGTRFRFSLIQIHADNRHQVGRFRISFSPSAERVGVSVSEELLALLVMSPESWSEETKNEIREFVRTQGGDILQLRDELAAANVPVPVAPEIQALRDRVKELSIVTPMDPVLARLQRDVEFSERQLESSRLTVAQDLTWALINSPAFLFNH